jgi:hypothetical protein
VASAEWRAKREQAVLAPLMKPTSESSTQEVLAGLVERVTFHNAESGFCVLRAKARGHRDLVTVVGHAAIISAGEWITVSANRSTIAPTVSSSRAVFSKPRRQVSLRRLKHAPVEASPIDNHTSGCLRSTPRRLGSAPPISLKRCSVRSYRSAAITQGWRAGPAGIDECR